MWIVMNDSFVSIVADNQDSDGVVVRARVREDLENLFPNDVENIIESENSDYRFRLYLEQQYVADVIYDSVLDIDYPNFKNSVREPWRKAAYTRIWQVMYDIQEKFYPSKMREWWKNYR